MDAPAQEPVPAPPSPATPKLSDLPPVSEMNPAADWRPNTPAQEPVPAPAADRRRSKFVTITCRGTNTNSDACFYFPTCTSFACTCRKENCKSGKQWKQIIENEVEFFEKKGAATTAAGQCYFYPVCTSQECGGQREGCQIYKDWIEAIGETEKFFEIKKHAKRKQLNERTRVLRAGRKIEKKERSLNQQRNNEN